MTILLAIIVVFTVAPSILTNFMTSAEASPELLERGKYYETWDNQDGTLTARIGLPVWVYDAGQEKYVPHILRNYGNNTVEVQSGLIAWRISPEESLIYGENFTDFRARELWTVKVGSAALNMDFAEQTVAANSSGVFVTNSYTAKYLNSTAEIEILHAIWDGSPTERIVRIDGLDRNDNKNIKIEREWTGISTDFVQTDKIEDSILQNMNTTKDLKGSYVKFARADGSLILQENLKTAGDRFENVEYSKDRAKFVYGGWDETDPAILLRDDTFANADPTEDGLLRTANQTGQCSTSPNATIPRDNTGTFMRVSVTKSTIVSNCQRSYIEWSISSIPDGSDVTNTVFKFDIGDMYETARNCNYNEMTNRPSTTSSWYTMWADVADGTTFVSNNSVCTTVGDNKSLDLGASADAEVESQLTANWFAVGIKLVDETRDSSNHVIHFQTEEDTGATPKPTLEVTYIPPGGIFAGDSRIESSGEQRSTYFDGTRNWIFYYNGACNISYKYSTDNGATWSEPASVSTGCLATNSFYTVYGEGTDILITYSNSTKVLTKKGSISGSSISWSPAASVMTVSGSNSGQNYYPSFEKVGSTLFLGFNVMSGGSNVGKIYSSSNLGSSWSSSADLYSGETNPAPIGIAEYGNANAVGIIAKFGMSEMQYKKWNGTGWSTSLSTTTSAGLTANASKVKSFSVTSDGDNAWVAYTPDDTGGSIRVIRFASNGQNISYRTAITGTNYEPTLTSQAGNIGIFFVTGNNVTLTTVINGDIDDWHIRTLPFGYSFTSVHNLHAEKKTSSDIIQVSWREGASSPYFIKSRVTDIRDTDNDGLYDSWETNGIDYDANGSIDLVLPGASRLHKDLFLEIDYMENHYPMNSARNNVIDAFAAAPVSNPDSTTGINLHISIDDELSHVTSIGEEEIWEYFEETKASYFGNSTERSGGNSVNMLGAKSYVYYYSIWVHSVPAITGGNILGEAEGIPGNDFYVALGPMAFNETLNHNVGNLDQQEGTLMHEFGHTLGLGHGGDQLTINCKPNYLSVMNYAFVTRENAVANRPLDFSRSSIASLDEASLDEPSGVGQSTPTDLTTAYGQSGSPALYTRQVGQAFNWNNDADFTDPDVQQDINNILFNTGGICASGTDDEFMTGYDDWSNLSLSWEHGINGYNNVITNGTSYDEYFTDKLFEEFHMAKLRAIDNIIQNIDSAHFKNETSELTSKRILHMILFEDRDSVENAIKEKRMGEAVSRLLELRSKFDEVAGGTATDDVVSDSELQSYILSQLDNVIATLKIAAGQSYEGD